jgi:isoquinoline 1-oxidoreductase beta subunit
MSGEFNPLRRRFLIAGGVIGGGLLVGCGESRARNGVGERATFPGQAGDLALNAWVRIAPDGMVTVALPRAEMGQGVQTALPMLVAEELGASWARIRTEQAPLAKLYGNVAVILDGLPFAPDDTGVLASSMRWTTRQLAEILGLQITGGSTSVRDAWQPMRMAGASAREMLVAAAAARLGVHAAELRAEDGFVFHPQSDRRLGFGELAGAAAALPPPRTVTLKNPRDFKLIGTSPPRLDVPAKVSGAAIFGIDLRLPDMLHAAVKLCPTVGGTLRSFDASAIAGLPGVQKAVAIPGGVAVVADSWYRAQHAAALLPVEFDSGAGGNLASATIAEALRSALRTGKGRVCDAEGNVESTLAAAPRPLAADYEVPYLAHACMEPLNCTARVKDGACEVWVGTQVASFAREIAAKAAGIGADKVAVHVQYLGGGFGRRLETDVIAQAVTVARETGGRPVKLLWSREADMRHDFYRPAAVCSFRAGLGADGLPDAWDHRIASASVNKAFNRRNGVPSPPFMPDKTNAEGAAHLPYRLPNRRVVHVEVESPLPVGFWRSVGHSFNAFFTESFLDECAAAAGRDPLAYRRALLTGRPRHLQVLELLESRAHWGTPLGAGRGRGVALHESFSAIVGEVAEVKVDETGAIRVERVVCVADCGLVVDPEIVRSQMESAIVFGLSAALHGKVTVSEGQVEQSNFHDYRVLDLQHCPLIEVHLVPSAGAPGGAGEPGTPPIAPAVANAIFAATGKRLRTLPFGDTLDQA